jgi:WD40 repeat protein
VAVSPDGQRLANSAGAEVKILDAQTGQELLSLKGHTSGVNSVVFSPDGQRLASSSGDPFFPGEVKVWDAQTGQELLTLKAGEFEVVVFSPNGHLLASQANGRVTIWDATPLPEE